jgi:hypothetical protein
MLRRYGASARRTYDRIMEGTPWLMPSPRRLDGGKSHSHADERTGALAA